MRFLLVNALHDHKPAGVNPTGLGLGYIASALMEAFGDRITLKVVDRDIAEAIKSFQPGIVGISALSKNYGVAQQYARIAKQAGLPVIVGGVHISVLPQTLTTSMDVGVVGEGEQTIVELLETFDYFGRLPSEALESIPGIVYWDCDSAEQKMTGVRPLIEPLDLVRYPARDLMPGRQPDFMLSSRGCPYRCAFCSTTVFNRHQARYASAEYVVGEIEQLHKAHGALHITIYDDLFAASSARVVAIQQLLERANLLAELTFAVNTRPDLVTDELADTFRRMNVTTVGMGIESGCQKTLDYLKSGGATVGDNARAIATLRRHGLTPSCTFIVGSPHEDRHGLLETIQFIKDNDIRYFDLFLLTPFPGTQVWEYAKSRGLVSDDMDWSRLDLYVGRNPLVLSEHMSLDEIRRICKPVLVMRDGHKWLARFAHPVRTMRRAARRYL